MGLFSAFKKKSTTSSTTAPTTTTTKKTGLFGKLLKSKVGQALIGNTEAVKPKITPTFVFDSSFGNGGDTSGTSGGTSSDDVGGLKKRRGVSDLRIKGIGGGTGLNRGSRG